MPKQETSNTTANANATAINDLATKLKAEQANAQLRLANYFTPYGYDPELVDFQRAGQLMETHGAEVPHKVFGMASENMQSRVSEAVNAYQQVQPSLEALFATGAAVNATDEQLFTMARDRVFSGNSAMARRTA